MTAISTSFDDLVNVGNKANQIAQIFGDLKKDTEFKDTDSDFVGANGHVGDGEFRDLMGGVFNYKHVDKDKDGEISDGDIYVNDAYNLLSEMLTGDGIAGVELIGLDGDSFTLAVDGKAGSVDFMVFEGQAAEEAIALVDGDQTGFDLNAQNSTSQFAILDLSDPDAKVSVGGSGVLSSELDVGNKLEADEVPAIVERVLLEGGYAGVELIDVDASSIALSFQGWNGTQDTLLITGIGDALAALEGGPLDDFLNNLNANPDKRKDDFDINGPTNVPDGVPSPDGALAEKIEDAFGFNFGANFGQSDTQGNTGFDDNQLLDVLVEAGGAIGGAGGAGGIVDEDEMITLIGIDSDSFTFSYEGNGFTDVFVFDYAA